jgi:hypothetical protein
MKTILHLWLGLGFLVILPSLLCGQQVDPLLKMWYSTLPDEPEPLFSLEPIQAAIYTRENMLKTFEALHAPTGLRIRNVSHMYNVREGVGILGLASYMTSSYKTPRHIIITSTGDTVALPWSLINPNVSPSSLNDFQFMPPSYKPYVGLWVKSSKYGNLVHEFRRVFPDGHVERAPNERSDSILQNAFGIVKYDNGLFRLSNLNYQNFTIDNQGKIIQPQNPKSILSDSLLQFYEVLKTYAGKYALVYKQGGYQSLVNENGEFLLPFFNSNRGVYYWGNDKFLIYPSSTDSGGVFDASTGKWILPPRTIRRVIPNQHSFWMTCELVKGGQALINRKGEIKNCPVGYDRILDGGTAGIIVRKANKWGLLNAQNVLMVPLVYDSLRYIRGLGLYAKLGRAWGIIDEKNKPILPVTDTNLVYSIGGGWLVRELKKEETPAEAAARIANELAYKKAIAEQTERIKRGETFGPVSDGDPVAPIVTGIETGLPNATAPTSGKNFLWYRACYPSTPIGGTSTGRPNVIYAIIVTNARDADHAFKSLPNNAIFPVYNSLYCNSHTKACAQPSCEDQLAPLRQFEYKYMKPGSYQWTVEGQLKLLGIYPAR